MAFSEKIRRVPGVVWALLFAALLLLPGLGAFGFWDPWELTIAEHARAVERAASIFDPTAGGKFGQDLPLRYALIALGMKMFGARELGARVFGALFGLGALASVAWAARGLVNRRAAVLSALALGTMPMFLLESRQIVGETPLVMGLALALGGLGRWMAPRPEQQPTEPRSFVNLVVAFVGLLLGTLTGGALLGLALPCFALAGALLVERDRIPKARAWLVGSTLVGVAVLVLTFTQGNVAGRFSMWLGGVPRGGTPEKTFDYLIRQIGFGIFPWSALCVFALGRALLRLGGDAPTGGERRTFAEVFFLVAAGFGFALTSIIVIMTGDARFAVLAPIAWAIGSFLDEALDADSAEPVLGLLIATGTLVVARDLYLAPEELVSQQLATKVKWPSTLTIAYPVLAVGAAFGFALYAGLAARARAFGRVAAAGSPAGSPDGGVASGGVTAPASSNTFVARAVALAGRWGIQGAVAIAAVFMVALTYGLLPKLSQQFSFKPVFESYARYAKAGEPIGKYHVEGHGSVFYSEQTMVDIPSPDRLVDFLRGGRRAFALVSAEDLPSLDAALKLGGVHYAVVDASSTRFLLLSNQLGTGEEDHNPLIRNVWMAPSPPTETTDATGAVSFTWPDAKPPWEWTIPVGTNFGDSIELLGASFPSSLRRPGKIPLKLFFRVTRRPPAGFKLFCHFDTPGQPRIIGDHVPLQGAFPTAFWLPGEYIKDEIDVDVPLMTTQAGTYTLWIGFWPGGEGKRIKIIHGNNDGGERTRVGSIEIR